MQQKEQALVDWVNSFNDPYCLLVNSMSDLTDGIGLCHLVGLIVCTQQDYYQQPLSKPYLELVATELDKIKQLVYYDAKGSQATTSTDIDLAHQNLDLALNILKCSNFPIPEAVGALCPSDLFEAGSKPQGMVAFLSSLKALHEITTFS